MKVSVIFMALVFAAMAMGTPDYVETKSGMVMGDLQENFRQFLGIPYAQPPLGDLRFASPKPATPWAPQVYNATNVGPLCPCFGNVAIGALPVVHVDEDCLHLNVFTPNHERLGSPLPVMFWIYGGAYVLGDGYQMGMYDGSYLASTQNVIVVTHNYRLGPFGFFYVEGQTNGNQAIEDQRLALQWVIDNIANFGGDPKKITIFGESAGAMSVAAHLTSPLSAGMFQRAIMQSNPMGLHWKTIDQAVDISNKVARSVRCDEGDLACLREIGWREMAYLRLPVFPVGIDDLVADFLTWTPTTDGVNLFSDTIDSFRDGQFNDVPMIIGVNRDEMSLFEGLIDFFGLIRIGPILYDVIMKIVYGESADVVMDKYPATIIENNLHTIFESLTDYLFKCASRNGAMSIAKVGKNPIYTYEFTHVPDYLPGFSLAGRVCFKHYSCHAMELPYVFHSENLYIVPISSEFTQAENVMSHEMIKYWVGFASGDINAFKPSVQWLPFSNSTQNQLEISTSTKMKTWNTDLCDFWDSLGYEF